MSKPPSLRFLGLHLRSILQSLLFLCAFILIPFLMELRSDLPSSKLLEASFTHARWIPYNAANLLRAKHLPSHKQTLDRNTVFHSRLGVLMHLPTTLARLYLRHSYFRGWTTWTGNCIDATAALQRPKPVEFPSRGTYCINVCPALVRLSIIKSVSWHVTPQSYKRLRR
jgi:hypothetical protein